MKYRDLVDRSTLVVAGCIRGNIDEYLTELDDRIWLNLPVLKQFKHIVISYNKDNSKINDIGFDKIRDLYKKYLPDCIFISHTANRGWIFGGIDLLKDSFSFIKDNHKSDYVWFLTDDFLIKDNFLDIDFGEEEYDFFGLPFFGLGGIVNTTEGSMNTDDFIKKYKEDTLLPQYNFHIIRSDAIAFFLMMESSELDDRYTKWISSGMENDQRDFIVGTERLLYQTIQKNKLNCKLIIDDLTLLVDTIKQHQFHDGAHKNLFFVDYGLCHYAYWLEPVVAMGKEQTMIAQVQLNRSK